MRRRRRTREGQEKRENRRPILKMLCAALLLSFMGQHSKKIKGSARCNWDPREGQQPFRPNPNGAGDRTTTLKRLLIGAEKKTKNKDRKKDFRDAGRPSPPDPIITRWATWLRAVLYYSENLPAVRTIVNSWTSAGLLLSRAKDAINVEDLVPDLVKINQYRTLVANVEFLEGSACTITEAYGLLKNMQFDDDPCTIKNYIKKRLPNSNLETIINCTNLTIDPTSYALLQKAQPTSAALERSFSMLSKLLRKDRKFDVKNVKNI